MPQGSTLSLADFRAEVRAGHAPTGTVRLLSPDAKPVAGQARTATFVLSDGSVDSYGDTIAPNGWVLDSFRKNPMVLYGHDPSCVENIIGKAFDVRVQGDRLIGSVEFAEASINPNAETIYQMVKAGFLNAVSVGFQPLEWAHAKDKSRPGGIDFTKQELLEFSVVAIPANSNALAIARAAGINVDWMSGHDAGAEERRGRAQRLREAIRMAAEYRRQEEERLAADFLVRELTGKADTPQDIEQRRVEARRLQRDFRG